LSYTTTSAQNQLGNTHNFYENHNGISFNVCACHICPARILKTSYQKPLRNTENPTFYERPTTVTATTVSFFFLEY